MEKSGNTISKDKFLRLSSRSQHKLLAALAKDALEKNHPDRFFKRYEELQAASELDRYYPPIWLSKQESLEEFIAFHSLLSRPHTGQPEPGPAISWQYRFDVEVVIDQVRSPYNIGSILRVIDNFALKGLVHSCTWLRLDHPQLRKAARGCEKWIPVRFEPDLPGYLESSNIPVTGIENEKNSTSITGWKPSEKCILVLGNETYGLASRIRECCDSFVSIPMYGFKKSMNVSHALAVTAEKLAEENG